jgi:hypothetical protein
MYGVVSVSLRYEYQILDWNVFFVLTSVFINT